VGHHLLHEPTERQLLTGPSHRSPVTGHAFGFGPNSHNCPGPHGAIPNSPRHRLPNAERYTQKPGTNSNYTFYFQIYARVLAISGTKGFALWACSGGGPAVTQSYLRHHPAPATSPRHHSRPETAISPSILHLQFTVSGVRGSPPCTSMHVAPLARCVWIPKEKKNIRISGLTIQFGKVLSFPHRSSYPSFNRRKS
jgi:hypothetical protein